MLAVFLHLHKPSPFYANRLPIYRKIRRSFMRYQVTCSVFRASYLDIVKFIMAGEKIFQRLCASVDTNSENRKRFHCKMQYATGEEKPSVYTKII